MENLQIFLDSLKNLESELTNDFDLGSEVRTLIRESHSHDFIDEYQQKIKESNDKYLRLLAEFDNYKKRVFKEREEIKLSAKVSAIQSILDLDSDLHLANTNEQSEGLKLIMSKFSKFLGDQGITPIQTETYDPDLHEVISITPTQEEKVVAVISRGYSVDGKPFRYPKIILGRPNE